MAQKGPHPLVGHPTHIHARSHLHHLVTYLYRTPKVRNLVFPFLPKNHSTLPLFTDRPNSISIAVLVISAVCAILSVTEIVLFAATKLHPLLYLCLQLVKTITWFVLFAVAAVNTRRAQAEIKAYQEEEQGDNTGITPESASLGGFLENLALL